MKAKTYCIAFGCLNSDKDPNLSFFSLPKDIERRRKWLTLVDRQDLLQKEDIKTKSYTVCSAHFDDYSVKIIKHLNKNAVPKLLLLNQSQEGTSCSEAQSTPVKLKGKGKVIMLPKKKRKKRQTHITVGTQTEILESTEVRGPTPVSFSYGTPRLRKLSNELRASKLESRRFPNDESVNIVDQAGSTPSKHSVVCSAHFKSQQFHTTKKGSRRPEPGPVPCLNLGSNDDEGQAPSKKRRRSGESSVVTDEHVAVNTGSLGGMRLRSGAACAACADAEAAAPAQSRELQAELRRLSGKVQRLCPAVRGKHFALAYRDENGSKCEYVFTSASETRSAGACHNNVGCNECGSRIAGFLYKCVSCADYNLCGACAALSVHADHLMMRIARPIKFKQARLLVARWCQAMKDAGLGSVEEILGSEHVDGGPSEVESRIDSSVKHGDAHTSRPTSTINPTQRTQATGTEQAATPTTSKQAETKRSSGEWSSEVKMEIKFERQSEDCESVWEMYIESVLPVEDVKREEQDPLLDPGREEAAAAGAVPGIRAHAGNIVIDPSSLASFQHYRHSDSAG